jgi:hypothetical protein
MPLEKPSDHALSNITIHYCTYCTDEKGKLKPYQEVLAGMTGYLVQSQGIDQTAAESIAKEMMSKMPAWKNH